MEPGHHRRAARLRPSRRERVGRSSSCTRPRRSSRRWFSSSFLCRGSAAWTAGSGRSSTGATRRQALLRADAARDSDARAHQHQHLRGRALCVPARRPSSRRPRSRRRSASTCSPGHVLRRGRDRALPDALPLRRRRKPALVQGHDRRRPSPDRVPPPAGRRGGSRARATDRPLALRARSLHGRQHRRRPVPRRLLPRAHVQRLDAPALARLLQPAAELGADHGRPRHGGAERGARRRPLPGRRLGDSIGDVPRQRRRRRPPGRDAPQPGPRVAAPGRRLDRAHPGRLRNRRGRGVRRLVALDDVLGRELWAQIVSLAVGLVVGSAPTWRGAALGVPELEA